jgi:hypothetical protein
MYLTEDCRFWHDFNHPHQRYRTLPRLPSWQLQIDCRRTDTQIAVDQYALMVITDEALIKASKIAAIEDGRNVSGIVEEVLEKWLTGRKARK